MTAADRAEALIISGGHLVRTGEVYAGYGALLRATRLLREEGLRLQRQSIADLHRQTNRPHCSTFPTHLRDAVIGLQAAAAVQGYLADRGDLDRQLARRIRVQRAMARVAAVVRTELGGGKRS
jgi:hypothetical protein